MKCGRESNRVTDDEADCPTRNEKYQQLIGQLITRYVDDIDEFGDIDAALRALKIISEKKEI